MKKILLPALLALCSIAPAIANDETPAAAAPETATAEATAPAQAAYRMVNYKGFEFEVPYDCVAELRGNDMIVRSAGQDFGVSLTCEPRKGCNQKRCVRFCDDVVENMHLEHARVKKVRLNGMSGAMANGKLADKTVTVAVLPHGDQQITCVVINDPKASDASDHVMRTIQPRGAE